VPTYHPDADLEFDALLQVASRELKWGFGQMMKRHLAIDGKTKPLTVAERLPASGPHLNPMYEVEYLGGLTAKLVAVYESRPAGVVLLALDGFDLFKRAGRPATDPDARSRAWARA
jgi:hypothetical protein